MTDQKIASSIWHACTPDDVRTRLDSPPEGLSAAEAAHRLLRFGPNRLAQAKRDHPFWRFLKQFDNILIYVLLGSSVGTALLGNWIDTGVITGVVVINAVIGFIQEGKAEEALSSIANMMSQTAMVSRDGQRQGIDASLLVPGDLVHLKSGDRVPADLRLMQASALQVEEAALTGESVPIDKHTGIVAPEAPLAERFCLAFAGTLVTHGSGQGIAIATGQATEVGRIGTLLASVETLATPLLRRISAFGRWLAIGILALSLVLFLLAWLGRSMALEEAFMAAVGLAVAAIPEGLPAVLTIALAVGVRRMATHQALIRRLPAVETLGSVTMICSDKTGTLTQNRMTVAEALPSSHGTQELFQAALLCNDAAVRQENGALVIEGAPTEIALMNAALGAGLIPQDERRRQPRISEIPFDSQTKRMATLHDANEGDSCAYIKGAPEGILALLGPLQRTEWEAVAQKQAAQGRRVLALAKKRIEGRPSQITPDMIASGIEFLGLIALIDPPRPEAIEAVAACKTAGVGVCMITGDHAETARAIGYDMGLDTEGEVLTGPAIDALDDAGLALALAQTRIIARATPEHKLRLVTAFQARGDVVAMTGDGVNDAPALKKADIGVAMGRGGTEAAKEAAMMVLADDNFATIARAVREGRAVYDNLVKSIAYILPTNMAQAGVILAAVMAGTALPITPVQILWVNMVTAVTLAMALAFEPAEEGVMKRPPRPPGEALITPFQIWRLALVTAIVVAVTFGLFLHTLGNGASMNEARTVAINALVGCEIAYLFNMRTLTTPAWHLKMILGSKPILISVGLMLLLQAMFTYAPPMQLFFHTQAISLEAWGQIGLAGLGLFLFIEAEKALIARFRKKPVSGR
ncbi:MAG: HAD-IC family P-type ATPase [Alphaproteobacteria bacterium]|nr:HAD-IC family P-type ATPase [Alphaproteobacteria bacterium]